MGLEAKDETQLRVCDEATGLVASKSCWQKQRFQLNFVAISLKHFFGTTQNKFLESKWNWCCCTLYVSEYETKQKLACHSVAVRPPATASAASKNLFACLLYSPPTPAQVFVPWRNDVSEPFVEAGLSLLARVSSIDFRDFRDLDWAAEEDLLSSNGSLSIGFNLEPSKEKPTTQPQ